MMRLICAWCTAVLREGDRTIPASLGICPRCAEQFVHEKRGAVNRRDVTSYVNYAPHPQLALWPRV